MATDLASEQLATGLLWINLAKRFAGVHIPHARGRSPCLLGQSTMADLVLVHLAVIAR